MRVAEGAIQWQYSGDSTWTNLVLLSSLVGPAGVDGKEVTFKVEAGYIQWQYTGDLTWTNLIELSTLTGSDGQDGSDGKEVALRVDSGFIQWQYVGDSTWTNLVELVSLIGPAGEDGINGVDGEEVMMEVNETHIQWKYESESVWTDLIAIELLIGPAGADGLNGIDGKEIVLQVADGFIQWQYVGDDEWIDLIGLSSLVGPAGADGDNGEDGKEVTFRVDSGYIQWQYLGDETWVNLIDIDLLVGEQGSPGIDGKEVTFRVDSGFIQWQYLGDDSWTNLVELITLIGPAGADGINGVDGKEVSLRVDSGFIQWQYAGDSTWTNLVDLLTLVGPAGEDGLNGVDGKEVTFRVDSSYIQWQYTGDSTWTNLVELLTLVGPAGTDGENGVDGKEVTLRIDSGYIQWQYVGDSTWTNLVDLSSLVGAQGEAGVDGREVVLRVDTEYIQWQYTGDSTWNNLIEIASLIGPAGIDGTNGIDGKEVTLRVDSGYIQWQYIGEETWTDLVELATLVGPQGETGVGIESAVVNETGELIITYTDTTVVNLGQLLKVYQVVFKDYNGYVLDVQHVLHGDSASTPSDPIRTGYNFDSWDVDFSVVTTDLVVTAGYIINSYTLEFYTYDGVTLIDSDVVVYGSGTIGPVAPVIEGYTFIGWSEDFSYVTANLTIFALYEINVYEVTFYDYNGAILSVQEVTHGSNASDPGAGPREGYTFSGWDTVFTDVVTNLSITAVYLPNQYTITYYDREYSIISTELVSYQGSGTYPTAPTVEGYDFVGWDKAVDRIEDDLDVIALYEIKTFTVIFRTPDGSVYDLQEVNYGDDASDPGYPDLDGYKFTGWNASYLSVTADLDIEPTYSHNTYTVRFYDKDSVLLEEQTVYHGDTAIDPYSTYSSAIDKVGFNFVGWSQEFDYVTDNLNCYPVYEVITFEVRFLDDDGSIFDIQTVNYGEDAYEPLTPSKEGHTFTGWDIDFTNVISDLAVSATYEIDTFTVSFYDINMLVFSSVTVDYHEDATPPAAPSVIGYGFIGWDSSFERVESDLHIYAIYEPLEFTVTFYDIDGDMFEIQLVNYGNDAVEPSGMEVVGHTFTGWDQAFTNVTEDLDVHPVYTVNLHSVTFVENGGSDVDDLVDVEYGSTIIVPIPTKLGYRFLGWYLGETEVDAKFYANTKVDGDLTLYARWELSFYDVTFYDYDNTVLRTLLVGHGYSAIPPLDPSRTGYIFNDWSESLLAVTSDLDVYAVYEAIVYTLVIEENGGDLMSDLEVAYETLIPVIDDPVRTGYTFLGWYEDSELTVPFTTTLMPLNGMTIYAKWEINQYTISFEENGGSTVDDITQDYATVVTAPADPTWLAKDFLGWFIDPEFTEGYSFTTMPAENITLYAKWQDTLYTISFVENGGSEIDDIVDIYQASITAPTEPTRSGYLFDGYFEDAELTVPYVFDTMPLGGDTVYVKWLINEYELTYMSYQELDIKLYATSYHSIFVTEDDQVFTVGGGGSGQLGNGAFANSSVLINITANFAFEEGEEVIYVIATNNSSYLLTSNGRVFTWGRNTTGQLGDSTLINKNLPVDITNNFVLDESDQIVKIFAGEYTAMAISSLGEIFAWGYDGYENCILIPGVTDYQKTPYNITALLNLNEFEKVKLIASGNSYSIFVTDQERVLSVGWNMHYQLGDGTSTNSTSLIDVTANFNLDELETIQYIGAGDNYNGVLTSYGRVLVWGNGADYRLGWESTGSKATPFDITSFFDLEVGEQIIELSTQYYHSVALSSEGRIFTWGDSSNYQTGTGNQTDVYSPKDITASFRLFGYETLVTLGKSTMHANMIQTSLGRMFAFGNNGAGALLDLPTLKYTPTLTMIREVTEIGSEMFDYEESIVLDMSYLRTGYTLTDWYEDAALSVLFTTATMPDYPLSVYAKWTVNQYTITFDSNGGSAVAAKTQDYGTYVSEPIPTKSGYSFAGWYTDAGLTNRYVFAVMEAMDILLYAKWEINTYSIKYYNVQDEFDFAQVSSGGYFTLALTSTGQVMSWGANNYGQLGDGTTTNRTTPVDISNNFDLVEGETITMISAGISSSMALTSTGRVFMWGYNYYGQLGIGTTTNQSLPIDITANFELSGDTITKVVAGYSTSYAITDNGQVFAWGSNSDVMIGDGTSIHRYYPKNTTNYFNLNTGEKIVEILTGHRSAAAITSDNRIFTWGYDGYSGYLARGTSIYTSSYPYDVTANFGLVEGETIRLSVFGSNSGIIVTSNDRIIGWGDNYGYELGLGNNTAVTLPLDITSNFSLGSETIVDITMGNHNTMLLTSDGRVISVGYNHRGALVTGNTTSLTLLTEVTSNFSVIGEDSLNNLVLSKYNNVSFAITDNGDLFACGNNDDYQIGDGTNITRLIPVQITKSGWNYYNSSQFEYLEIIVLIADPTRVGYTFSGWYSDLSLTTPFTLTNMPANNLSIYAKWNVNQYTISFDSVGGSAVTAITQNYGTSVNAPAEPTKAGYTFAGWYLDALYENEYEFDTMGAANITLYAKWEINTYNITYYDVNRAYEYDMIAGGGYHTIGLTTRGQVLVWGQNNYGQLGDGTLSGVNSPVEITAFFGLTEGESIIMVEAGMYHSMALTSTGRLFMWGRSNYGQVGMGVLDNQLVPYDISASFGLDPSDKIVYVGAGDYVTYALTDSGRVFAFGQNDDYTIGDNTNIDKLTPFEITSYFSLLPGEELVEIKGGARSAAAYSNLNRIFTWGHGDYGQLASLEPFPFTVPTDVSSSFSLAPEETITILSLGAQHAFLYTSAGRMFAWGYNTENQLSDPLPEVAFLPMDIAMFLELGAGEIIISVDAGYSSSIFITSLGRILAVGADTNGVFGNGVVGNIPVITDITANIALFGGETATEVVINRTYSSFIISDVGTIYGSGANLYGQIGVGSNVDVPNATPVIAFGWQLYGLQTYDYNETLSLVTDPTNGGLVFDGWYTDPDLLNPFTLTEMPAGNIILYAKWSGI
jgi:uncharacterized repeat protein (TIGR02543 family)